MFQIAQLRSVPGILRPQNQYRINPNHPLANGLLACWLPGIVQERSLPISQFATNPNAPRLRPVSTVAVFAASTAEGPGNNCTSSNSACNSNTEALSPDFRSNPISVYWRGVQLGNPSAATALFGCGSKTGGTAPFTCNGSLVFLASPFPLKLLWNSNGTDQTGITLNSTPPTTNTIYSAGGSLPGAGGTCSGYFNGANVGTSAFGANAATWTDGRLTYGAYDGLNTRFSNTAMIMGCMWNRVLSDEEHMYMHVEPYGFLVDTHMGDYPYSFLFATRQKSHGYFFG